MERTPSPPRRLHTPPAPLHGAKYDSYEPYSPRRSSRVAKREQSQQQQQASSPRFHLSHSARETTPTGSRKKSAARISLQGLSPPSSPISPNKLRSPRSTRRNHSMVAAPTDSDSDQPHPTPARRFLSAMEPRGMLPTPAKTPRKRALQSEESLSSTARVLFPSRPANVEDAMPTPRKGRKNLKSVFSLESFAEQKDDEEQIAIYTDSKERIPTNDEDIDNPFVTRKGKGKAKSKANGEVKAREVDSETAKMQAAVNRDEGMIYVKRGRKIYRQFDDVEPANTSDEAPDFSGDELRRKIGIEASRPLTRSKNKPRLLFQEEIKKQHQEMGIDDVDEEAVTDIEVPIATPSRRKTYEYKAVEVSTPVKRQEATPPPTVRRPKREISFDSWSRVKSASRGSTSARKGEKRSGDTLESAVDKRTRSEPSSAMSLDSN